MGWHGGNLHRSNCFTMTLFGWWSCPGDFCWYAKRSQHPTLRDWVSYLLLICFFFNSLQVKLKPCFPCLKKTGNYLQVSKRTGQEQSGTPLGIVKCWEMVYTPPNFNVQKWSRFPGSCFFGSMLNFRDVCFLCSRLSHGTWPWFLGDHETHKSPMEKTAKKPARKNTPENEHGT